MKKLVLFDIDGTVLNVESNIAKSIFVDTFGELFNIDISHHIPSFHGKTDLQILSDIRKYYNINHNTDLNHIWDVIYNKFRTNLNSSNIEVLPGVRELINLLAKNDKYAIGLVTGNFKKNAYLKLSLAELDNYFHFGGFGDDSENRNMLPEIALERAKRKKIINESFDNENAIIIGDTFRDIQAARHNKMKVIAVATGKASVKELSYYSPDYLLENLSDYTKVYKYIDSL